MPIIIIKTHFWDGVNFWDGRLGLHYLFSKNKIDKYFDTVGGATIPIRLLKKLTGCWRYASINEEMNQFPAGKICKPLPEPEIHVGRCCLCSSV
ncbi:MAG: hypothetical protein V9F01_03415 [Chitinophagaceae bacterium]